MRLLKTALRLPRYTRRKPLNGGVWAYYFEPPTWARKQECPVEAQALGSDYAAAVRRAEEVLLPAFDSWRTRGLSDLVPIGLKHGSFDWLVSVFKQHHAWSDVDPKTRRLYEQGLSLVANYVLKDGTRTGNKQIADFSKAFVDGLYSRLLVVEDRDVVGNVVTRSRRRFANAAMQACRRAWFIGQRAAEKDVPHVNPFSRMGLKRYAAGEVPRATPTATFEELQLFRVKAAELGYQSLATAALTAWEWLQREEHLFGAFEIAHYRPKGRPDSVRVVHPKTGEEAWWPLFDDAGNPLFPELMAELDAIKAATLTGLVFRRDHPTRRSPIPKPWITDRKGLDHLRGVVKTVIRAAGLRDELSFASFRHGGFTEGADADWTDAELRAAGRHRSAQQLPTYAKRTQKQLISASTKRRAIRTKPANLSE